MVSRMKLIYRGKYKLFIFYNGKFYYLCRREKYKFKNVKPDGIYIDTLLMKNDAEKVRKEYNRIINLRRRIELVDIYH